MRTSITTGFIIYFHFRFFVDIIEVLIPLHYISLTEIYLMICNEGIWILLSLEENRNIIFFFCRILGLLLVSHPSGRGCKTFHKWYRFWFEGMIESLTATALFSSYISSSYCGLGAVTVRNEERKDDVTAPIPISFTPVVTVPRLKFHEIRSEGSDMTSSTNQGTVRAGLRQSEKHK